MRRKSNRKIALFFVDILAGTVPSYILGYEHERILLEESKIQEEPTVFQAAFISQYITSDGTCKFFFQDEDFF